MTLRSVAKALIPPSIGVKVHKLFDDEARQAREARERSLPRVRLSAEHIQNCELVLDRTEMLGKLDPGGVVAELGVDRGGFSEQILEITHPSRLHLVDVWGSERYHSGLFDEVSAKFEDRIAGGTVQIHRNLSIPAADDFEDATFDWIYIDTDHTYETTRDELLAYERTVKPDGIIAGHDYSMGNWVMGYRYGVMEAVHEFCVSRGWEFVYLTMVLTERQSFAIRRIRQP